MESWWKNAVIYQIYPRSFKDTNSDGVGDLAGIIEKLDYLNDGTDGSLGIDAIWLSPIYKSPMADLGYDISDYYNIDSVYGRMTDFEKLISGAHKREIKVIMDYIPNHTSDKHPWFIESKKSRDNPKRDWYIWRDAKPDGSPPNNWLSVFGGSAWTIDKKTDQYYLHSFLPEQPDLNWRNPLVETELQKVLKYWMAKGVDGFRTDALNHLIKDEQFRDEPPNPGYKPGEDNPYEALTHIYTRGQEELVPSISKLCSVLGEQKGRFMVGEMATSLPTEELLKFQNACTNQLHLPFNFNLINLAWEAKTYKKFIDDYDKQLSPDNTPNWVLGNHDQTRIASRIGKEAAKIAAMLTLTLRGTLFIYYGEEIGMEDTKIPKDKIQDPWEKRVEGFGLGRDPERTPMQWNRSKSAGFSKGEPWLPVNPNFQEVNVAVELKDSESMLSLYRRLIWYRKSSKVLLEGSYKSIGSGSKEIFSYIREKDGKKLLVALNFSSDEQKVTIATDIGKGSVVLSTYLDLEEKEITLKDFTLRPNEGILIEQ